MAARACWTALCGRSAHGAWALHGLALDFPPPTLPPLHSTPATILDPPEGRGGAGLPPVAARKLITSALGVRVTVPYYNDVRLRALRAISPPVSARWAICRPIGCHRLPSAANGPVATSRRSRPNSQPREPASAEASLKVEEKIEIFQPGIFQRVGASGVMTHNAKTSFPLFLKMNFTI